MTVTVFIYLFIFIYFFIYLFIYINLNCQRKHRTIMGKTVARLAYVGEVYHFYVPCHFYMYVPCCTESKKMFKKDYN